MTTTQYGEYTRDRVGWFFGMTGAQLAVVTGSGLPLLLSVGVQAWALAGVCLLGWAGVLVLVLVPVHGRSATQWLGALAAHTTGRLAGWSAFPGPCAAPGSRSRRMRRTCRGFCPPCRCMTGHPGGPR